MPPQRIVRQGVQVIRKVESEPVYEPEPREPEPPPLSVGEAPAATQPIAPVNGSAPSAPSCMFCDNTEASDTLIPGFPDGGSDYLVCGACVERLVDAMRLELPRRRLRLAMERLMAGSVSIEMVEQIEKLAEVQSAKVDWGKTDG
jgi:hypothetical protein